ncbi:hypothetical protein RQP46_005712 [Phenoliferia psychrophenolica]
MQGSATSSDALMQERIRKSIFNKWNGNRSETGGLLPALRTLTLAEIAEYHASMYQPQNATIIVIGSALNPAQLLRTLHDEVEPTFVASQLGHGPRPPGWIQPFIESSTAHNPPSIPRVSRTEVRYPSQDESTGTITITWIGPRAQDFLTSAALLVLITFLSDSAVSPLSKIFMDVPEPACGGIGFSIGGDPQVITAELDAVPVKKLKSLPDQFLSSLSIISGQAIDMERMRSVIQSTRLSVLRSVETSTSDYLCGTISSDALYGPEDGSELDEAINDIARCRLLARWTSEQWAELLERYFVHSKCLIIIGRPSSKMVKDLDLENTNRIRANIERYRPSGLATLDNKLNAAVRENAKPVPDALLRQFTVPDLSGIHWITPAHVDRDVDLPLFIQFEQMNSNFVTISITLAPSGRLEPHLRSLIPLYIDTFAALPTHRSDGRKLSFEETVKELNSDTGVNGETFVFNVTAVKENYARAILWMNDLLEGSVFSKSRLDNSLVQSIAGLPEEKQDGSGVASQAFSRMIRIPDSTAAALNVFTRAKVMPAIRAQLQQEPSTVIEDLEDLRSALTDHNAMRVLVTGDIRALETPTTPWVTHFAPRQPSPVQITLLPSIESTFGQFGSAGPTDWNDADLPALTIARGALNATEGFLWNAIRGAGLAYDASIGCNVETGVLTLVVFKSPDVFAAWNATRVVIDDILSGKTPIRDLDIEAAKSSYAYSAVTLAEVLRAIRKYIKPLLDPSSSIGSVTCSGNWGSAIARLIGINTEKHDIFEKEVKMWCYEEEFNGRPLTEQFNEVHENVKYLPGVKIAPHVVAHPDLLEAVKDADALVIVVPQAQGIKVNEASIDLLPDLIEAQLKIPCSALSGANIANEVARDAFSETTIGCRDAADGEMWKLLFETPRFRVHVIEDLLSFIDGLGWEANAKAAIMRIGIKEMRTFSKEFFPGSAGVADVITSCLGGRNHRVAMAFVGSGKSFDQLEREMLQGQKLQGVVTAQELHIFLKARGKTDEYPLFTAVYRIALADLDPAEIIANL